MQADCGITGVGARCDEEMLVMAFTPGIPLEWLYAALKLPRFQRRRLLAMIDAADPASLRDLGMINAASVVEGDGWKMLVAVAPDYSGAVPLWSQIELRNGARSDQAVADALGVDRQRARRWRTNTIFCPVSLVRLTPNRGRKIGN